MKREVMWLVVLMVDMGMTITTAVAQIFPTCPPFVQEGKVWEVERYHRTIYCDEWGRLHYSQPVEFFTCTYTIHGDTLVDGNAMKRVYRNDKSQYGDEEDHYFAAVREDDSRVFIVYAGQEKELCLYDFRPEGECEDMVFTGLWNRNVEDSPQNFDMTVKRDQYANEDTLVINGYTTRRFFAFIEGQVHNYPHSGEHYHSDDCLMIEGFGNVHTDPFDVSVWIDLSYVFAEFFVWGSEPYQSGNYEEAPSCSINLSDRVEHVYVNGTRVASSWDFSGESTAVESLQAEEGNPALYDLTGRRLTREPEKGMYIKNGRKYLKT